MSEKTIIKTAGCLFIAACLVPPWQHTFPENIPSKPAGYSWIFAAPDPGNFGVRIDFGRLIVELAIIGAATGTALFGKSKPTKDL